MIGNMMTRAFEKLADDAAALISFLSARIAYRDDLDPQAAVVAAMMIFSIAAILLMMLMISH